MSGKLLLVYNPIAGRGRVRKALPEVMGALQAGGVHFDSIATREPLDALQLAQNAAGKYRAVVSVGGDGTFHEIANGLLRAADEDPTLPVGIIPLGTGDDFAKVVPPETRIGGKPFGWRTAVEMIIKGEIQRFDVMRITGDGKIPALGQGVHYAVNSLSLGFGAHAAYRMATSPRYLKGMAAYLAAILQTLVRFPVLKLTFTLDGRRIFKQRSTISAVMNGRSLGSTFWIAPEARIDDGLLDLVTAAQLNRFTILRMIPKLMRATHTDEHFVNFYQARQVLIESDTPMIVETDGEVQYHSARWLQVDVLPGRLTVIC